MLILTVKYAELEFMIFGQVVVNVSVTS